MKIFNVTDVNTARRLLKHSDLTQVNRLGRTPLHTVQTADIARLFLEQGADVKAESAF